MPHLLIDDIEPIEIIQGYVARFIHTQNSTIAFWSVQEGAAMPLHQHIHEQVSQVLEGKFELVVDEKKYQLGPGEVVVIPPNAVHGGRALTYCRLLDIFTPVREDYKTRSLETNRNDHAAS
jgi:quercetin dioxygenase-like cupin family protein